MPAIKTVAFPLQLEAGSVLFSSMNDASYRHYARIVRHYYRVAQFRYHCDHCREPIYEGDYYIAWVHLFAPARKVPRKRKKVRFWVEKKHYPECPDDLREIEKEMYEDLARDRAAHQAFEMQAA